jgi:hypothetical protein
MDCVSLHHCKECFIWVYLVFNILKGHWGHSKTGYYYNGLHHDDVLKGSHLGIDCMLDT